MVFVFQKRLKKHLVRFDDFDKISILGGRVVKSSTVTKIFAILTWNMD